MARTINGGSTAYMVASVTHGKLSGATFPGRKPWDTAAYVLYGEDGLPETVSLGRDVATMGAHDPVHHMTALFERATELYASGEFSNALDRYREAVPLYRLHGSLVELAMCLMDYASCLLRVGKLEEALLGYDEALPMLQKHGQPADYAGGLMNHANCMALSGKLADALAEYGKAKQLYLDNGLPAELARCLMNQGACLSDLGQLDEALDCHNESVALWRTHGPPDDLALGLMNRADCLDDLHLLTEAVADYDEAVSLYRDHGIPLDLGLCLMNRGVCLQSLGKRELALADYDEALPLLEMLVDSLDFARCKMNRASCLEDLGRSDEALLEYDDALGRYREQGSPAELADCLMNRANTLVSLGNHVEALASYEEAVAEYELVSPLDRDSNLRLRLARCLMNRASCLDDLGRHEDALAQYDEALPLYRVYSSPSDLADCIMNRATTLEALGRLDEALEAYDEARTLYMDFGLPGETANCLVNRAGCLDQLSRPQEALEQFGEAFSIEDRASSALQDVTHRRLARVSTVDRYRTAVRLAIHLDQIERAWEYVQRGKGRTLTDLLEARAERTAVDYRELLLVQQHESNQIDHDAFIIGMQQVQEQRLNQRTARFGRDVRSPMTLEEVSAALRANEVLLDFFSGADDSLFLFLIEPRQTTISLIDAVEGTKLKTLVDRWQAARDSWLGAVTSEDPVIVARRDALTAKAAATEQQVLAELGEMVFTLVLEQLDETVTTLIISSDGMLHHLPLAAVTLPGEGGHQQPLIDRLDLQLVPTVSSLAILRGPYAPRLTWPAALLAAAPFAVDDKNHDDNRALATVHDYDRAANDIYVPRDLIRDGKAHEPLPASGPEIQAVAACLTAAGCPTSIIPTPEATRLRLEADLPAAHILHLATHGGALEQDETVLDYRIFLAGETEVRVRELYEGGVSLQDVVLVTLSACSLGEVVQQGAEALGFVQAFLQAGAGVVLAPLWAVDDRATKELMVRFYAELTAADKPTIARAWRRACQRLRTETAYTHPIYWAGFLPSGDASLRLSPTA